MTSAIVANSDSAMTLRFSRARILVQYLLCALTSDLPSTILFLSGRLLVRLVMTTALHLKLLLLLAGCELYVTLTTN